MTHPEISYALWKLAAKRPDRLCAVDIVVLRPQERGRDARKARVGQAAWHAMAAAVDAVEHDVAPRRAARVHPRHRALVRRIAVVEIGAGCVLRLAAIDAAPERQRLFGRPKTFHREAAGALATLIRDQGIDGAVHDQHRHRALWVTGGGRFG